MPPSSLGTLGIQGDFSWKWALGPLLARLGWEVFCFHRQPLPLQVSIRVLLML